MAAPKSTTASTVGPDTFDALMATLRERRDTLSPAHRRLADRVMSDPEAVAFMTAAELAAAIGVNEATVVRFASGLGLKGYPGLKRLCRAHLQEQAQLVRRFDTLEATAGEHFSGPGARAATLDQANISRTFARIDMRTWDSAVQRLAHAPRVHVMGLRKLHAPAYLLGYLLGMLREEVDPVTASAGSLTDDLRRVRTGDCFVAMSIHRYSADTVRAAQWAHQVGAHVVVFTDNPSSPLVAFAHDAFYIDASSTSVLRSMTAFTSVMQALAGAVALLLGHKVRDTLLEEERLLDAFNVYLHDD